jgi:hypothetical protein
LKKQREKPNRKSATPLKDAGEISQKLLLTTLALEQALWSQDNAEISALFNERERLLTALSESKLTEAAMATLRQVVDLDARVTALLEKWRTDAVSDIENGRIAVKASALYQTKNPGEGFSVLG